MGHLNYIKIEFQNNLHREPPKKPNQQSPRTRATQPQIISIETKPKTTKKKKIGKKKLKKARHRYSLSC